MSQFESSAAEEQAIIGVIDRYADALNHRDWDKLAALFIPEGVWQSVNFRTFGFKGAKGIADGFKSTAGSARLLVQMRSSTVVNVRGDTATARSTVHEVGDLGTVNFLCYGSYNDRLQRRNGVWCFAERNFRYLYWQEGALTGESFPPQ